MTTAIRNCGFNGYIRLELLKNFGCSKQFSDSKLPPSCSCKTLVKIKHKMAHHTIIYGRLIGATWKTEDYFKLYRLNMEAVNLLPAKDLEFP
jgi:hypothetical protein